MKMTHEKVIKMIDEYILQDNINDEWVEALKVCRDAINLVMPKQKMSDDDIIKALKFCSTTIATSCKGCPLYEEKSNTCITILCQNALDLFNRKNMEIDILIRKKDNLRDEIAEQQAEIERLNKEVDRLSQCVMYHEGQIIDAIKEFAERLKEKGTPVTSGKGFEGVYVMCSNLVIDNTLKEIIGDNNG